MLNMIDKLMGQIILITRVLVAAVVVAVMFLFFSILFLFRPCHKNNTYICTKFVNPVILKILGIKLIIKNRTHLLAYSGPKVIIANHQHSIDIFTISSALPPNTLTVGKTELLLIPVIGLIFFIAGNILINRKNSKSAVATMKQIKERMKKDSVSVFIFPEGTRSWGRGLLKFKKGAFYLAKEAQVPIFPLVVSSVHKFVDLRKLHAGTVIIDVLPMVQISSASANTDDSIATIRENFLGHLEKLDQEAQLLTCSRDFSCSC